MNWTRIDALRRWIVVVGLIAGPALLVLSVAINLTPPGGSMRTQFAGMGARSGLVIAEAILETIGFTIVLASFAGASGALRHRGGLLGTWGAVLAILGIIGFSYSNANGFTLAELAQLPDQDRAFATAVAITASPTANIVGTMGMALEIFGQIGILLVIWGLVRARLVSIWPLLIVLVGMIASFVVGTMPGTLAADLLLLVVCTWIAVRLARCPRAAWLGSQKIAASEAATATV